MNREVSYLLKCVRISLTKKLPETRSHFDGKRDERTRKRPKRGREQVKSGAREAQISELAIDEAVYAIFRCGILVCQGFLAMEG